MAKRKRRSDPEAMITLAEIMPDEENLEAEAHGLDKFWQQNKVAIFNMAARGFTEKEIAECIGVSRHTVFRWKKRYPDFFNFLKIAGDIADNNVVVSLYQRAMGYHHPEVKVQWIEELKPVEDSDGNVLFNQITGKPVMAKKGRWEKIVLEKYYPPDTTAMIFWLKNRRRDEWRDTQEKNLNATIQLLPYDKDL